jgi:hypothetical protein
VVEDRPCRVAEEASPAVSLEELDADPTFELGEPLRQRGRADADLGGRVRPGGRVGDGDEVLELAEGDVGEVAGHPVHNTSDFLNCHKNRASSPYRIET